MTVTEPRFRGSDLDMLLASRRLELEPRGAHGFPISKAIDPSVRGRIRVGDPTRDFIQQAIDKKREAYRKQWGEDAEMGSLYFRAEVDD